MDQVEAVSTAPLRWNQHPVISTVLWILGSENKKSPAIPPISSIDNFRPEQGGLDEYLNKHFEQVERRRSSDAEYHRKLSAISEEDARRQSSRSNRNENSRYIEPEDASDKFDHLGKPVAKTIPENEEEDGFEEERTSSSDGTQLYPSIHARQQQQYGQGYPYPTYGTGTPGQGGYYPAQHYAPNGNQYANNYDDARGSSHMNDPGADASPSPQWGFYVAITPPQQDMYNAIKKDLVTIQQQQQLQGSAQKSSNQNR